MHSPFSSAMSRRAFLADLGMGFTGLALAAMLHRDGVARADSPGWTPPDGKPHFAPEGQERHLVLHGRRHQPHGELRSQTGADKVRRQDHRRDALQGRAQQILPQGQPPHRRAQRRQRPDPPEALSAAGRLSQARAKRHRGQRLVAAPRRLHRRPRRRPFDVDDRQQPRRPAAIPHRPAQSGGRVSDDRLVGALRTRLAQRQPAAVRRAGHAAGRLLRRRRRPRLRLPRPGAPGRALKVDPKNPLPFASPGADKFREEQKAEFDLLGRLNRLSGVEYPDDPALRARIKSYELAFRMQTAVPEVFQFRARDGGDADGCTAWISRRRAPFGQLCLAARRLVERGVRFVQVFHGSNGGAGAWDAHGGLKANHATPVRPGRSADRGPAART